MVYQDRETRKIRPDTVIKNPQADIKKHGHFKPPAGLEGSVLFRHHDGRLEWFSPEQLSALPLPGVLSNNGTQTLPLAPKSLHNGTHPETGMARNGLDRKNNS